MQQQRRSSIKSLLKHVDPFTPSYPHTRLYISNVYECSVHLDHIRERTFSSILLTWRVLDHPMFNKIS